MVTINKEIKSKVIPLVYSELTKEYYKSEVIVKGTIRQCFESYWYYVNRFFLMNTDDLPELIEKVNKLPHAKMDYFNFEYTFIRGNGEEATIRYIIQLDPNDDRKEIEKYYYGK